MESGSPSENISVLNNRLLAEINAAQQQHGSDSIEALSLRAELAAAWRHSDHYVAYEASEGIYGELLVDADRILGVGHELTLGWRISYIEVAEHYGTLGDARYQCDVLAKHFEQSEQLPEMVRWIAQALLLQLELTADEDPEWRIELALWDDCEHRASHLESSVARAAQAGARSSEATDAHVLKCLELLSRIVLRTEERPRARAVETLIRETARTMASAVDPSPEP